MREYKMRRGESLEDRIQDMPTFIEDHFGSITGREEYNGSDLYVVADPNNPVFERVRAGTVEYSGKKDKIALDIEERPVEEVIAEGHVDAAENAVNIKNDFLEAATGRDAKSRRESLKRSVENDAETPDTA